DAGIHVSEETKDASLQLPRAMMISAVLNGILGVAMLITFCFCITDLEEQVLNAQTDYPIIDILYSVTKSKAGTCVLVSLLIYLNFIGCVGVVVASSRQLWAFSRDNGVPFSAKIKIVSPKWKIPMNSLYVCFAISVILTATNFGSDMAFTIIVNVSNAFSLFSYTISIGCIRLKRLRGEPLLPRRWSLGKYGGIINDISLAWLVLGFIFSFFPMAPYSGSSGWWKESANYSFIIFLVACFAAFIYHWKMPQGEKRYVPPVFLIRNNQAFS
ncbi:hypothetical protein K470DRAFT_220893, partial [Piedraia hortae CBS 480.64]